MDALFKRRSALADTHLEVLQSTADALAQRARDEERVLKQLQQDQALRKQRERARLDSERDQLQRKRRHLQLEEDHVRQSRSDFDDRVRGEGRPLFERKDALVAQRDSVAVRIQADRPPRAVGAPLTLVLTL